MAHLAGRDDANHAETQHPAALPGQVAMLEDPAHWLQVQICRPSAASCLWLHTKQWYHAVVEHVACVTLHSGSCRPNVEVHGVPPNRLK